MKSKESNKSKN